jgi:alanine racemase
MHRSEITIDLGALRRNARRLREVLGESELWAVVKADAYGHGAVDVAGAVLDEGAAMLCVATTAEAVELRREFPEARILIMGPTVGRELATAREAGFEVTVFDLEIPEGVRVHLKLDTGMGRWGLSGFSELPNLPVEVVGLMTHLATADSDPAFAQEQLRRFEEATTRYSHLTRHAANSAAAFRLPEACLDAVRCGIALYGLSPFGGDPGAEGLEPVLRWESRVAQVKQLAPGESTGYGRRFSAKRSTWIGVVPIGYADGFRRDMTGTEVAIQGERRRVVGTISMDAFAVELPEPVAVGTPVTLIGDGVLAEEHAVVAETINYEIVCGIDTRQRRSRRTVLDA